MDKLSLSMMDVRSFLCASCGRNPAAQVRTRDLLVAFNARPGARWAMTAALFGRELRSCGVVVSKVGGKGQMHARGLYLLPPASLP